MSTSTLQLKCQDIQETTEFLTGVAGFRLDEIFPADSPRRARLSKGERVLELVVAKTGAATNGDWQTGRAGMQYRDLVPDRLDGHVIASHIRIPDGGPVPDYVHYHDILFQSIYCYKGWVRVVYEDQGPPFVMQAGDCVLQPPGIRHRVLECSDGFEVIEFGCPAEHVTHVEHDIDLPTAALDTERLFGGQKFVRFQADGSAWQEAPTYEFLDTGISNATNNLASLIVVRPRAGLDMQLAASESDVVIVSLFGSGSCNAAGCGSLQPGDCIHVPAGQPAEFTAMSEDFRLLVCRLPAR